jgi:SAM-dependent methyltransferase
MSEIQSYSHVQTNRKVLDLVRRQDLRNRKILDVGAGEGYFTRSLGEQLQSEYPGRLPDILFACDLYPENFRYDGIACRPANFHERLPYEDETFDLVLSIEVIEHLEDQFAFIRELHRVAKPGGTVLVTTPNILNINSRIRQFYTGFALLFDVLPLDSSQPVMTEGHIHPISPYYLAHLFYRAGFQSLEFHYDRRKKSSLVYLLPLYPLIKLLEIPYRRKLKRKRAALYEQNRPLLDEINSLSLLSARTVIIAARK